MLKTTRPNMLSLRDLRVLLSACICATFFSPVTWANPQGDHEAEADIGSEYGSVIDSGSESAIAIGTNYDTQASAVQTVDGINGGVYRYFGYQSADVDAGSQGVFSIASNASTTISSLDASKNYVVLYTHNAIADGPGDYFTGVADFSISTGASTLWSSSVDRYGTSENGTKPVIVSGLTSITFNVSTYVVDFGFATASSAISLFELTTDSTKHNDCDVNDDGVTDALDIDMLNNVLNSGVAGSGANTNLIAMFDVDGDNDVDVDDRDELVEGAACLDTSYGDVDLDGDVDTTDANILASNLGTESGMGWADGDLDGDGDVDSIDENILAANFGN